MKLADNIKAVANRHGKTISAIADEMGVAQSHVSRTINNPRITLQDMEKLSQLIGCEVSDFFVEASPTSLVCPHCGKPLNIHIELKGGVE